MNRLMIIGNLVRDPETRTTQTGLTVCNFTVAVNRRAKPGTEPQADYFQVSAWRQLGENCQKYLAKGRKVAVEGPVSVSTYTGHDGTVRARLDVVADTVEFLTPRSEQGAAAPSAQPTPAPAENGYTPVQDDDLPF